MAADISSAATFVDGVPNLNMKMCYAEATAGDANDWVDMANVGMTAVYMAVSVATADNTASECAVNGTQVAIGTTEATRILAIGV